MDVTALTQARDDDINALCARHGVALSALGYYPNALDPDSEVARRCVAHLKNVIVAAQKLGLKTVNTFASRDWTKSVDDNWPRFLRTWRPLITFAEDHGIRIGIGNCPMLFTRDEWPGGKNLMTTPVNTAKDAKGREHHAQAFTCWMAGGGVRGGHSHGETDDFGNTIVSDSVHVHDLHATILHLLGLDHTRLTYRHAGRDYRLTDVYGTVVNGILG